MVQVRTLEAIHREVAKCAELRVVTLSFVLFLKGLGAEILGEDGRNRGEVMIYAHHSRGIARFSWPCDRSEFTADCEWKVTKTPVGWVTGLPKPAGFIVQEKNRVLIDFLSQEEAFGEPTYIQERSGDPKSVIFNFEHQNGEYRCVLEVKVPQIEC